MHRALCATSLLRSVGPYALDNRPATLRLVRAGPTTPVRAAMMMKIVCVLLVVEGLSGATSVAAGNMGADEARRFVIGNLFSFTCFEGTSGEGRVNADGSVGGVIRLGGSGFPQYATLPPGTLRVRGDAYCALISGMPYEACFDLDRTDARSFRGSLAANRIAFCQFTRPVSQAGMARTSLPLSIQPTTAASS